MIISIERDGPGLLAHDAIRPDLEAIGKYEAVCEIVEALSSADRLSEQLQERIVKALLLDEEAVSTAIEGNMAILHVTLPAISAPVATVARSRHGVEFSLQNGTRTSVIVLLVSPPQPPAARLRLVAMIARHLRDFDQRIAHHEPM